MRLFQKKKPAVESASPYDQKVVELIDHHGITLVFDIGANIGQHAQRLRGAGYQGRIVSFEPLASNHQHLSDLSAADPSWEIAPRMAVGDRDGETEINVSHHHDMSSVLKLTPPTLEALPKARVVSTETVPLKTLDSLIGDFCGPEDKLFIKVDTQGYEQAVLNGAQQSMASGQVAGWQLELSLFPLYDGEKTYEDIAAWLKDKGYEAHYIFPGYFSKKLMRQLQIDGVFFRS